MIVKPYTQKLPVWGSQIVFLSIGLDDHSSISRYIQTLTFLKHKLHYSYCFFQFLSFSFLISFFSFVFVAVIVITVVVVVVVVVIDSCIVCFHIIVVINDIVPLFAHSRFRWSFGILLWEIVTLGTCKLF